jgi:hypothetical protein
MRLLALPILALLLLAPHVRAQSADHEAVLGELAALRREVAELKQMVAGLQEVLAFVMAGQGAPPAPADAADPATPAALPRAFAPAGAPAAPAPEGEAAAAEGEAAPVEFSYVILREWGRSPSQAAALGEGVTSLKGMVLVVPRGSMPADLEQLGRDLRTQFGAYDNINIEVFDDPDAAESYTQTNVGNPAHRVLSVSRHRASGRDVILAFRDGMTLEVTF